MTNIADQLIEYFRKGTLSAFPDLEKEGNVPIEIAQSSNPKFGNYQFNTPMKLAKVLGMPPRQIAEKIKGALQSNPMISNLEIAGPGFINITIATDFLNKELNKAFRDPRLGIELPEKPLKVVIDFSSPNTAKEMHVGHLRSTIIGDSLARLLEFYGHDVLRLNHIGDWGTAFGMLIAYMQAEAPDVLAGKKNADLPQLMQWYKQAKLKFDSEPEFKKASQLQVVALQSGDPNALKAWELICKISRDAYQQIYDLLDIKIQERGESFYNPMLADTVKDLESKGLVQISEGAKCIFLEGFQNREGEPLPLMVQKSDGGFNYDTTDMAAMRQRVDKEKADWIIIVTDAGQATHFQMIFAAAKKAGYLHNRNIRLDHVPFGLVLGLDGKKFRTRSGETEKLIDLITAAIDQAKKILDERSPEMGEAERSDLAHKLGISAIKYSDLASHRLSDYVFSYDKMLKFEGNTAAFLLYAYVRVAGIKRKVGVDPESLKGNTQIDVRHPSEVALGLHLLQFSEALESMAQDLTPNRLTDYLYTLAEKFNAFFRDCRVEGSPEQNSRLLLAELTARTLAQGLEILGIHTVDKM